MQLTQLPDALKAFLQLLMARKIMSNDKAIETLQTANERFDNGAVGVDLDLALSKINKNLKFMELEVRSMKLGTPDGALYHCVVNKTADEIAKVHGSNLLDWQIEFFRRAVQKFGESENSYVDIQDLEELRSSEALRSKKIVHNDLIAYLRQLVSDHWLSTSNNLQRFRLGIRSFLELPELLISQGISVPQIIYH